MQDAGCRTPVAGSRFLRLFSCLLFLASCLSLLISCAFPGTIRPTVKIGLVAPFEGRYRYVGYDVIYAARLAVREANAAGGVGGYSVELVAYDDSADPVMAVEQAHKLAVDPEVVAAIGHFRSETTIAAVDAYAEADIFLLSPGSIDPYADAAAGELLRYLEEAGLERVALVTGGGPLGLVLQRDARIGLVASPQDAGWLDRIKASDAIICDAPPVTAGEVAKALWEAGWGGVFLGGPELAAADFTAVAGEAVEGARFVTPWPFPRDVPDSAGFVAAYRGMGPHVQPPGPLALPAYEATWRVLEALERDIVAHGAPTREGIVVTLAGSELDDATLYWYRIGAGGVPEQIGD
ncbi:MAG: branched-chain amino acid ABC transporter substrate-binding protein [Anaerolineae bacterium]|jgi:branched-chain amino acid transport system substrate-binding protein